MRTITLSDGRTCQVSPLKGKDVREIVAIPADDKFTAVFAALERAGFPEADTDELPFPDVLALHKAVLAETYGVDDEIKN